MPAFDPERMLATRIVTRQEYTERDCILYALGVGVGAGPSAADPAALRHLIEHDLVPLPAFATMLAYPGAWYADPAYGLDPKGMVNGGQELVLHGPLPAAGAVTSELEVEALTDKGTDRGLLIHTRRTLRINGDDAPLATIRQTYFHRSAGGFGGSAQGPQIAAEPVPERPADVRIPIPTRTDAALLFRLSGDWNLIHADPAVAQAAGFEKPVLQGLATFGMAAYAIGARFGRGTAAIEARYSAPVTPGDTLLCECWDFGEALAFRIINEATERVAIDRGRYLFSNGPNNRDNDGETP